MEGITLRTTAVRLYGKEHLRLESFDLPRLKRTKYLPGSVGQYLYVILQSGYSGADHKKST